MQPDLERRSAMQFALLAAAAGLVPLGDAFARPPDVSAPKTGPARDFDFFIGAWAVKHRRLKKRLAGNDDWEEFDGTCRVRSMLGGLANFDDSVVNLPGGAYRGIGLRSFDAKTDRWADWWLDGRNPHKIDPPVIGTFANGLGSFLSDDAFEGKPIKVRGLWSKITAKSLQWEQAFSPDGGKTWETNWVMRYARTA